MTMLAAAGFEQIAFAIAAAIYGVYVWWSDRKKKQEEEELQKRIQANQSAAQPTGPAQGGAPQSAAPSAEPSEQEKLRKFLEALGVPTGQPPAPQPPRPVQPMPPPRTAPPPRPVIVAPPPVVPRPAPRPVPVPVPRPVVVRETEPVSMESREAGGLTEASDEMMRAAFHDPTMVPHTVSTPAAVLTERPMPKAMAALKEALKSQESLRAAFVVREVLGPPPGLSGFER